jgi:hypothetical protein
MSWPEDFHPEVGYLLPSLRVRRLIRFGSLGAAFGLLVGVGSTLSLLERHGENPIPTINRPTSTFRATETPRFEPGESIVTASVPMTTAVADTSDSPMALRRFVQPARPRGACSPPSPTAISNSCSFHRNRRTYMAAVPVPDASPVTNDIPIKGDDATQRPKKSQKTTVTQTRRQKTVLDLSDYPRAYASPGLRYGERASFDRGDFW